MKADLSKLTPSDMVALRACVHNNILPARFVQLGGYVTHYRWFRLVAAGLAKNIPPRLTREAIDALARKEKAE